MTQDELCNSMYEEILETNKSYHRIKEYTMASWTKYNK